MGSFLLTLKVKVPPPNHPQAHTEKEVEETVQRGRRKKPKLPSGSVAEIARRSTP